MNPRELALFSYCVAFVALICGLFWRALMARQILSEFQSKKINSPRIRGFLWRSRTLRQIGNSLNESPSHMQRLYSKHRLVTRWCIVLLLLIATFPFVAYRIPA